MKRQHGSLYLIEFVIIGGGFALLLSLSLPFYSQLLIIALMLVLYSAVGLLHHKKHRNITSKVVLEYTLISVLILTLFIFLNITKL